MSDLIKPGAGVLYMKVGTHAQESLEDILVRKRLEIASAGYALWGYGGGTCHPQTMVQPFAAAHAQRGQAIYLFMEEIESRHFADPLRADQSSADGITWNDIPSSVNVLGSRYALVIKDLRSETLDLPLANTRVAVGNSYGRIGSQYLVGRVDKACLEVVGEPDEAAGDGPTVRISLIAEITAPYAVFLRNIHPAMAPTTSAQPPAAP
jgi:hypothetical protein